MNPQPAPIGNSQFLAAIFAEHAAEAHVTGFVEPPDNIPRDQRGLCWAGRRYGSRDLQPGHNNYFVISTFNPLVEDGRARAVRRKAQFALGHCVVVDDVGTKVKRDDARLRPPTWRLETSPGNEQWGYLLDAPCADGALFSGVLALMVAKGLSITGDDPGMKGVTRYVRLPVGVNRKIKYGDLGFVCKMQEWQPERRYTIDALLAAFGATQADARALAEGVGAEGKVAAPDSDRLLRMLDGMGLYQRPIAGKLGWHEITCPWLEAHSDGDDSGTAVFVREDGGYGFQCHHGHCEAKTFLNLRAWMNEQGHPVTEFMPVGQRITGESPPPVQFVLDRWMQRGKVGLIASEGGTGKTTLLIHLGICIVLGLPFMGVPVTQRGPFMMLSRDDDQDDLDAVTNEIVRTMALGEQQLEILNRDLYIESYRGVQGTLLIKGEYEPSDFVERLAKRIASINPVCVAIDTIRQFTGTDSTNEAAMIVFMDAAAVLAKLGPAVILAHHVGKQAAREKIVDMYSAIGSSALADNARFMWRLISNTIEEVDLPFSMDLPEGMDLLQLISTRGSLRVKRPDDIFYTRQEFALAQVHGKVTKLSKEQVKDRKANQHWDEQVTLLIDIFRKQGKRIGRDKAKQAGWIGGDHRYSQQAEEAWAQVVAEKDLLA
jgi:hypothetical protein